MAMWCPGSIDLLGSWVAFQMMKILPICLSDELISHQEEDLQHLGLARMNKMLT